MRQIKVIIMLFIIISVISGCASLPAFKSGIVSRDYMIGLLPFSSEIFLFFDFWLNEEKNLLTDTITQGLNNDEDIGKFMKECNIDPEKDLYSVSIALSNIQQELKYAGDITMVLNLNYDREILIQRLLKEGFREEEDHPYKISLFSSTHIDNNTQIAFLSNTLILVTYGTTVSTVLDDYYEGTKVKGTRPFENTLEKISRDAPLLSCMHGPLDFMTSAHPNFNLFANIDEIGMSIDYTEIDIMIEVIFIIKDQKQREILHSLIYLTIESSDVIENKAARKLLEHTTLSKDDEGIKLNTVIPILVILSLIEESEGIFL